MQITLLKEIKQYYKALIEKNSQYIGTFIVGVVSTGICCLPTCRARKPKLENCEFYRDLKSSLVAGFRPYKICQPEKSPNDLPEMPVFVTPRERCISLSISMRW